MSQLAQKVLVADADEAFAALLCDSLQNKGVTTVVTTSGFKAKGLVDEESFAAIITAVKLQLMNGLQVAESAQASKLNARTPVLILADEPNDEARSRVKKLAAAELIVKPITPDDITKKIIASLAQAQKSKASSSTGYDVRIMNAFIDSLQDVFSSYFEKRAEMGRPGVKAEGQKVAFLSSMISFTGDAVKGSMALSLEKGFLLKLSSKLFQGANKDLSDPMLADMAGEMANQVCGNVKRRLAQLGLKVMIGLPKVVIGADHKLIHIVKNPVIAVPARIEEHQCIIEFCMSATDEPLVETKDNDELGGGDVMLF